MKKTVTLAISIFLTLLVFGMSLQTGPQSAAISSPFARILDAILRFLFPSLEVDFDLLHVIVRKFAHMTEYALLGASYMLTAKAWEGNLWPVYLAGVLIAFLDEWLQTFVVLRFPYLVDVLLFDIPGYVLGAVAVLLIGRGIEKRRRRSQNNVS